MTQPRNFLGKVYVSQHAVDQAVERFSISPDKAEQWIRDNLKKARYVSTIVSADDGKEARLFVWQRIAYLLAVDMDRVVTTYAIHHSTVAIRTRIQTLLQRELTVAERKEAARVRSANVEKAKLNIERAQCEYRMVVTPSKAVMTVNTRRIHEIDRRIAEIEAEVLAAKKEKTQVAKGLVAYL